MVKILLTAAYGKRLSEIEDFIFESTASLELIGRFLDEHDRALLFLSTNPGTPALHPETGDQSWIFGDGRYRIFYNTVNGPGQDITLYLTHLIDNRQANIEIYPGNSMPTYDEDE
jgi:hypothetical protein